MRPPCARDRKPSRFSFFLVCLPLAIFPGTGRRMHPEPDGQKKRKADRPGFRPDGKKHLPHYGSSSSAPFQKVYRPSFEFSAFYRGRGQRRRRIHLEQRGKKIHRLHLQHLRQQCRTPESCCPGSAGGTNAEVPAYHGLRRIHPTAPAGLGRSPLQQPSTPIAKNIPAQFGFGSYRRRNQAGPALQPPRRNHLVCRFLPRKHDGSDERGGQQMAETVIQHVHREQEIAGWTKGSRRCVPVSA